MNRHHVAVFAPLEGEAEAALRHLSSRHATCRGKPFTCTEGIFRYPGGKTRVSVVTTGKRNENSAFVGGLALDAIRPDFAILQGKAGKLKDAEEGDAVIGESVLNYAGGSAEDEFLPRPESLPSSSELVETARLVSRTKAWKRRLPKQLRAMDCRVLLGAMASGAIVQKSSQSPSRALLRHTYGEALVVEMEAYGFLLAATRLNVPALVIRAPSDHLDNKAESEAAGSEAVAFEIAAALTFEVVARFYADQGRGTSRSRARGPSDGVFELDINADARRLSPDEIAAIVNETRRHGGDSRISLEEVGAR